MKDATKEIALVAEKGVRALVFLFAFLIPFWVSARISWSFSPIRSWRKRII